MASLQSTLSSFRRDLVKLEDLASNMGLLPFRYRKLSAELIHLRLYLIFENTIEEVAYRLAAGVQYCDGTRCHVKVASATTRQVERNFLRWGRANPIKRLVWSNTDSILNNVSFVFEPTEHFCTHFVDHKTALEELRHVRNRIAHKGGSAAKNYKLLIKDQYGVDAPSVTPGTYLLTTRFSPTKLLHFIKTADVFLKTLCKA